MHTGTISRETVYVIVDMIPIQIELEEDCAAHVTTTEERKSPQDYESWDSAAKQRWAIGSFRAFHYGRTERTAKSTSICHSPCFRRYMYRFSHAESLHCPAYQNEGTRRIHVVFNYPRFVVERDEMQSSAAGNLNASNIISEICQQS